MMHRNVLTSLLEILTDNDSSNNYDVEFTHVSVLKGLKCILFSYLNSFLTKQNSHYCYTSVFILLAIFWKFIRYLKTISVHTLYGHLKLFQCIQGIRTL